MSKRTPPPATGPDAVRAAFPQLADATDAEIADLAEFSTQLLIAVLNDLKRRSLPKAA